MLELRRIKVNGAELSYVEQGTGEAIVFVHGAGTDWRVWEEVRPFIARRYRFVAYSRRFHAPNAWPDGGSTYTIAQHVEDLAAFIRTLGVEKAHVVGLSIGGRIVAEAALAHPERFASVVVGDAFVVLTVPEESKPALAEFARQFEPFGAAVRAGDALGAAIGYVNAAAGTTGGWSSLSQTRREPYRDNVETMLLAARDAGIDRRPSCEALGHMAVPTLVLDGENTAAGAGVTNDALAACLAPHAERARIAGSGHFWYVDRPRESAETIMRFVAEHPITR